MSEIKFYNRKPVPVEMHKVKIVQKLNLLPARERLNKLKEAGFNRSEQSMYEEWAAHNTLYRWGYKRERTASVDIDQGESFLRLLAYAILALL